MRCNAGYSLLELMIGVAVVLGLMAGVAAMTVTVRADSRQQDVTQAVLAVASVAIAQSEFEGASVSGGSAAQLAARSRDLGAMLSADSTHFIAGGGVTITPTTGLITVAGMTVGQCADAARAVAVAVPGIAGIRVNATTGAYLDTAAPAPVLAACGLQKPATLRVEL